MYDDERFRFTRPEPELDDMDRRENALNARIAAFESIVRKTKISTAERIEHLTAGESELSARWDELREEIDALTGRENDLRRREAIIARKAADLDARETALRQKTESFRARSEKVLSEISRQKEEVRRLISARLG
ncbi:MAG: hypothetical protein J6S40_01945 [Thermoguttaceae bacterium]|nr:hypothetical protein [Thermoguttaceae bacterium]